jgi:hypothetical protein
LREGRTRKKSSDPSLHLGYQSPLSPLMTFVMSVQK